MSPYKPCAIFAISVATLREGFYSPAMTTDQAIAARAEGRGMMRWPYS
jgi:hypothetical protein